MNNKVSENEIVVSAKNKKDAMERYKVIVIKKYVFDLDGKDKKE